VSRDRPPSPAAKLIAADGKETTLAAYAGRVVVANFWATWCAPCIQEMPALERLHAQLGNDNRVAVGEYVEPGSPQRYHAFYYYPGIWLTRMAGDNPAPELAFAWQTHAYAINKHGRIAGEGVRLPNPFLPPPPDMGDLCYERLPIQWPTGSPNPARLFCVSDVNNNNTWDDYEGMSPAAYDVNDSGNFVGTDGASTPNSMFLFKDGQRIPVPAPTGVGRCV